MTNKFDPAILAVWRTIRGEAGEVYWACHRGRCAFPKGRRTAECDACARYRTASANLSELLGLRPWESPPHEAVDDPLAARLAAQLDAAIEEAP